MAPTLTSIWNRISPKRNSNGVYQYIINLKRNREKLVPLLLETWLMSVSCPLGILARELCLRFFCCHWSTPTAATSLWKLHWSDPDSLYKYLIFFNWRIISLQWCVGSAVQQLKSESIITIYIPSLLNLLPTPDTPFHPSSSSQSTRLGSLCYITGSH